MALPELPGYLGFLETGWEAPNELLTYAVKELGPEGMESLGVNLAIGGTVAKTVEGFLAASDARKAQTANFRRALADRERLFSHELGVYKDNAKRTNKNVRDQYRGVMRGIFASRIAAEQQISYMAREARQAQSEMTAGLADRGVTGITAGLLIDAYETNQKRSAHNMYLSQMFLEDAKIEQMGEIYARGESRRTSMIPSPAAMPSVPSLTPDPNIPGAVAGGIGDAMKAKAGFADISRRWPKATKTDQKGDSPGWTPKKPTDGSRN